MSVGEKAYQGILANVGEDGSLPTSSSDWRCIRTGYQVEGNILDAFNADAMVSEDSFLG